MASSASSAGVVARSADLAAPRVPPTPTVAPVRAARLAVRGLAARAAARAASCFIFGSRSFRSASTGVAMKIEE